MRQWLSGSLIILYRLEAPRPVGEEFGVKVMGEQAGSRVNIDLVWVNLTFHNTP